MRANEITSQRTTTPDGTAYRVRATLVGEIRQSNDANARQAESCISILFQGQFRQLL